MTVQTFIPNGAKAASENTVTCQRTPLMFQLKNCILKLKGVR